MAPMVRGRKGEYGKLFEELRADGYSRVKVDGELRMLDDPPVLDKKFKHDISVVVDRLVMRGEVRKRLADSVETAVALADGIIEVETLPREGTGTVLTFSEKFACLKCGTSMPELEPRIFSFNSPHGACERCTGLGSQMEIDPDLVVPDQSLSLAEGALAPWATSASQYYEQITEAIAKQYKVDLCTPWQDLTDDERYLFLNGIDGRVSVSYKNRFGRERTYAARFEGIIPNLERRYRETDSEHMREKIEEFMGVRPCPACHGSRLRPESRSVLVGGTAIHEFASLSVRRAMQWLAEVDMTRSGTSPGSSCGRSRSACASWTTWASATCRWTARRRRCRAARRSASGSPRRSARRSSASSTSWTSRPSACTSATTRSSSGRSSGCATSATRCSSWSTTSRRCARPIT